MGCQPFNFMVLYEDNSVEVYYLDGSRLLLSPCGSEFLFEHAVPASAHPLQPPERVRQRTQFAISIYREQLLQAIDFRNQYSEHPYLPSGIIPPKRKSVFFTDIYEASWPSPDTAHETICMHNGIVKVSSLDGHTCLFLPELQQDFTVEFFCKVSQKLSMPLPFLERGCNESTQDQCGTSSQHSVLKLPSKQLKTEEKDSLSFKATKNHAQDSISSPAQTDHENCSSEYSKVIQHMSVSSCPEEWKYPLSLAFMFYQLHACNRAEADEGNQKSEDMQLDASQCEMSKAITCLPSALPLSCHAPYLHRWTFMDFIQLRKEDCLYSSHSQAIKVLWNKGVIYRLEKITVKSMEIYPGDGSVFKSEGSFLGKYFTRYFIQEKTKQREETMYSVSSLPPDIPGSPYSVGEVITQAVRILQHDLENILSLAHNYSVCCWKVVSVEKEMLPVPLAENVIPNVGRFFAYPDNKIHAVFHDGMILNMVWDFGSPYGKSQDASTGWCKLTSPEGSQQLLHIDHPGVHERYYWILLISMQVGDLNRICSASEDGGVSGAASGTSHNCSCHLYKLCLQRCLASFEVQQNQARKH
uniref:Chromosome 5 open reading frame 34 n=1 Tax=Varanus komodoensis TaxID=61221 RepID=A0A8D2IS03_VARKO